MCVRPSFEQNNKGDSHWINIINCAVSAGNKPFPQENLYDKYNKVKKYDNRTILLPTKLKYSREHMNNLTNLIWALLDPHAYALKVGTEGTKNGLCGFDYKYHGMKFLKKLKSSWQKSGLWERLFNRKLEEMNSLTQMNLLYKGYQWRIGSTGYVWEFKSNIDTGFRMEIQDGESEEKVLYDFGGKGYDITAYCSAYTADTHIEGVPQQFDNNGQYYWVVRYKKGEELSNTGKASPTAAIAGCEDVYRYNKEHNANVGDPLEVESAIEDEQEEEPEPAFEAPLDNDQAETAWRWLSALTDARTLTDDWNSHTYEPTIGQVSSRNTNTRIVVVSDIDEAQQSFASIAGIGTGELNQKCTVSLDGVGNLTWTPSANGNVAEVTVGINIIPSLQKIVYCTEDQMRQNGLSSNVNGTAYYRLGDVIRDPEGYYWVCVRPAFEQNNKYDSHWINIFNYSYHGGYKAIPAENIYDKYNQSDNFGKRVIKLPTKLKYSREHMNNLSNLIWALLDPEGYASKVGMQGTKNGLCGFDYNYHGKKFLNIVNAYWNECPSADNCHGTVWQLLFNRTKDQMKNELKTMTFFYKGYSWRHVDMGSLWEFSTEKNAGFQKQAQGSETTDGKPYDFGGKGFDINVYSGDDQNAELSPAQFGNDGHYYWVVRYKTSSELAGRSVSPFDRIEPCTDIYRYNEKTIKKVNDPLETESDILPFGRLRDPQVGCIIGQDGNFYTSTETATSNNTEPTAFVVYYGELGSVETGTQYRGIAINLVWAGKYTWISETMKELCPIAKDTEGIQEELILDGIACTEAMKLGCNLGHEHMIANLCTVCDKEYVIDNLPHSKWFVGSIGQWILAAQGMGIPYDNKTKEFNAKNGSAVSDLFEKAKVKANVFSDESGVLRYGFIWTSTLCKHPKDRNAYGFRFLSTGQTGFSDNNDVTELNLYRQMVAF